MLLIVFSLLCSWYSLLISSCDSWNARWCWTVAESSAWSLLLHCRCLCVLIWVFVVDFSFVECFVTVWYWHWCIFLLLVIADVWNIVLFYLFVFLLWCVSKYLLLFVQSIAINCYSPYDGSVFVIDVYIFINH